MTAYLQMGHDTENLVGEVDLEEFSGIILSPVNRPPEKLRENVAAFRARGSYDIILDPQLYFPRGRRENLVQQPYFPSSFDTADYSSPTGWATVIDGLSNFCKELGVNAVASPVILPRRWSDEYYDTCVETAQLLSQSLNKGCNCLATCLVSLSELYDSGRAKNIASILTRHDFDGFYLVIDAEIEPRREISDTEGLVALMSLIKLLEEYAPVTVAYSSSDMLLFKSAGATNCGTSKFFNLRRFTTSRFEEPPARGGGQLPYWFEHNLLAFLREADIRRLQRFGYGNAIGGSYSGSQSGKELLQFLVTNPGQPWLAKSWRQYLSWFGKVEAEINSSGISIVRDWLVSAETLWQQLNEQEILMDEPRNEGSWIRPWRQVIREFQAI